MSATSDREPGDNARLSALLNQATRALAAGDRPRAIVSLEAASRLAPAHAPIHHDLGFLRLQEGRPSEAVAALRTALELDPTFAQASLCLGCALQELGDAAGAESAYRRTLSLQASALAHICLGALLDARGETAQALDAFRAGAACQPGTLWSRLAAVRALVADDRDLEAEPTLRELGEAHPANGMVHEMLATVLANTGRFDEARQCYELAIAAAPALAGCYYDLARCRRVTAADATLVERMQGALLAPEATADTRAKVHLALGKALDDLGDPQTAMQHFDAADTARRTVSRFDVHDFERRIDRLIAHFTPARFARDSATAQDAAYEANAPHNIGDTPILIMGLPRSGTTLLEQVLSSHPQVYAAGELAFWTKNGSRWDAATRHTPEAPAPPADVARWAAQYLTLLQQLAPGSPRVTDKMPLNILWAGLIHQALPHATLIYCRRTPVDTALSIHRTYFNPHLAFPTGGTELVATIRAVRRLADHWRAVLQPDRYLEVDYEALVSDPEPTIRRVTAACRLPWDATCLQPQLNARVIKTPSKWQARQPIHRAAVDSWRLYAPWLGSLAALLDDSDAASAAS